MKTFFAWMFLITFTLHADIDPTTIIVKTSGPEDAFHRKMGAQYKKLKHVKWTVVQLKETKHVKDYKDSGWFEWVAPNRIYSIDVVPNDPFFFQQWCHQIMQSEQAWDVTTGNEVVVAQFDTGINYTHPDLTGNLWTGSQGEHGYTCIGGTIVNGGQDDNSHGSHVAGIIGAVGNNALGVVGINWRIKLLSMKFLDSAGRGMSSDALILLDKMIELKERGVNIRISANSWGGPGYDIALEDGFKTAEDAGILNICAAGNNNLNTDSFIFSPAGLPLEGIISVLASDSGDNKAVFSNYGSVSTDLLAPGVNIMSTVLGDRYGNMSGTSMAAPQVAGACAMLFALNPSLSPGQAKSILLNSSSYDQTTFIQNSTRGGRINLKKLWSNPLILNPPPPNAAPVVTLSPDTNFVVIPAGQTQNLNILGTDPDGDTISYQAFWDTQKIPSFIRNILGYANFSFSRSTNSISITGNSFAFDQARQVRFTVSDGQGAATVEHVLAWTPRDTNRINDLSTAILGFRVWKDSTGWPWFRLDVDPAKANGIQYMIGVYGGSVVSGGFGANCCFQPNIDIRATINGLKQGTVSVRPIVTDNFGNFITGPQAIVYTDSTNRPPTVKVTYNKRQGVAPLTVTADMNATIRGQTQNPIFVVHMWDEGGDNHDIYNPVQQFTLTEPGVYAMEFTCADNANALSDRVIDLFTVLPPVDLEPPPPPEPILTPPKDLTVTLLENGLLRLRWQDTAVGEDRWIAEIASKSKGPWGPWQQLATLPANSRSYTFDRVGGHYQFRVKACKTSTCGTFSNVATIHMR